ncbi:MAG: delta-60 repeat domain-containing protein, partial [Limisphaerales bacterium]
MLYTVEGSALAGQQFSSTNVTVIYGDGEIGRKGYRVPIFADPAETGTKTFSVVLKAFNSVSETTVLLKDLEAPLLRATAFFSGGTNAVRDMAVGGDGVVYVAGNFTSINGKAMTNLARLHADLTLDTSFVLEALPKSPAGDPTMQTNVPIRSMAVRPNGMVAFSGDFTEIAGNNWISTAQVRPDGTYDEAFTSNNAATAGVMMEARHLALQPDEQIIATTPDELRRLNADGTKDTTFAFMRMPEGRKTVVHRDGGIYLLRVGSISRIDARNQSLVTIATVTYRATTSGSGSSSRTHALCIDRDGSLLVGGEFTHVNGVFSPRIARISTNGVVDTNFVANVGQTVGSAGRDMVTAIEVLANGDILVGGNFKQVEGEDKSLLALLRPDGTMRNEFDFGAEGSGIAEFERTPDGGVVVRGSVTAVDGNPAGDLFKLGFRLPLAPVVEFLWPTNGALVGVSDVEDEIRVHAFDPDGVIERAVLELDGVTVGTNSSGNIPFRLFLSGSGEHMLRLTVTDEREMTTSETITFRTVGQELAVTREGDEVVTHYYGAGLQESTDMAEWRNVHSGGGEYRTTAVGERRFFRSMQ